MTLDLPGFTDPVLDSQACFRAMLDAMAQPGTLRTAGTGLTPPAPLAPAAAAMLLTLVDGETSLFLAAGFAPAGDWIGFHCGALPVAAPDTAAFVLTDSLPDLAALHAGSDESPDTSATVILQVTALGSGRVLRLSGPGLRRPAPLAVTGLPENFPVLWAENHALYPRGIDILLCSGCTLAALPRSVRVEG
jgi:alpha-D-ribose 1-methylphosphonate 5-triphosphate synthase subunit PhnH